MAFLRRLGLEGRSLWNAIEALRTDLEPLGSFVENEQPSRRIAQVKIGVRVFWLAWEVTQDRGESVIEIILIEQA